MSKIKNVVVSLAFLTTLAVSVSCGSEAKEISIIKKGSFTACSSYTIEELANSFMGNPKWVHTVKNGITYVSISGHTTRGKPTNIVMQFWVRGDEFGFQTLEIDKMPQNDVFGYILGGIITQMCESAQAKYGEAKAKANSGNFTDSRDNKNYRTIKIGSQIWMAENLNINVKNSVCYNNEESNCQKYGRLYYWETAKTACPSGWHLPSKDEWDILSKDDTGDKHLKTTNGWNENGNGLDTYGFAAVPGGDSNSDGIFFDVGKASNWWSSSEYNDGWNVLPYGRHIYYNNNYGKRWDIHNKKSALYSVRCLKD